MIYCQWTTPLWKLRSVFIQISVPWPSKPWYLVLLGVSLSPEQSVRLLLFSEPACPILPRHIQLSLPWHFVLPFACAEGAYGCRFWICNPNFWEVLANAWKQECCKCWLTTIKQLCHWGLYGVFHAASMWLRDVGLKDWRLIPFFLSCPSNKLDIAKGLASPSLCKGNRCRFESHPPVEIDSSSLTSWLGRLRI